MLYLCRKALFIVFLGCCSASISAQSGQKSDKAMSQARMAEIITSVVGEYQGSGSSIQFKFNDVDMALLSDVKNNRMRIIAPIAEVVNLTDAHIKAAMVSNFHLALDARYAIGNGVLYAAYIHPLAELTDNQLEAAIKQVSTLRLTFGSTYTSGALTYGASKNVDETDL